MGAAKNKRPAIFSAGLASPIPPFVSKTSPLSSMVYVYERRRRMFVLLEASENSEGKHSTPGAAETTLKLNFMCQSPLTTNVKGRKKREG